MKFFYVIFFLLRDFKMLEIAWDSSKRERCYNSGNPVIFFMINLENVHIWPWERFSSAVTHISTSLPLCVDTFHINISFFPQCTYAMFISLIFTSGHQVQSSRLFSLIQLLSLTCSHSIQPLIYNIHESKSNWFVMIKWVCAI